MQHFKRHGVDTGKAQIVNNGAVFQTQHITLESPKHSLTAKIYCCVSLSAIETVIKAVHKVYTVFHKKMTPYLTSAKC